MRLLLLSFALILAATARAEERYALVVGMDRYEHAAPLANAVHDAETMAATLARLKFRVTLAKDLDRGAFVQIINEFFDSVSNNQADCALFYYAGHGIQSGGRNFLIPRDFNGNTEESLWQDAVPLDRVIFSLAGAQPKVSVVILDACRTNPLGRSASPLASKIGLAPVNAPLGSLIAYSADAGQVAADGIKGGNGLYTGVLLRHLTQPGLRAEDVFNRTRREVSEASHRQQTPAEYSKLLNTFYFLPDAVENLPGAVLPPIPDAAVATVINESSPAIAALRGYYDFVNHRDFELAYGMLSKSFRSKRSIDQYRAVFDSTFGIFPVRLSVGKRGASSATIDAQLVVVDAAGERSAWFGPIEMVQEEGTWKVETARGLRKAGDASMFEGAAGPQPKEDHPAVGAVQTYYRAINLRDFEAAYQLLSDGFKSRRSLRQYSAIFDDTLSTYLTRASVASTGTATAGVLVEVSVLSREGRRSVWVGVIKLTKEGDSWKIDSMRNLKER